MTNHRNGILTDDELQSILDDPRNRVASSEILNRLIESYQELRDGGSEDGGPTLLEYRELYRNLSKAVAELAQKSLGMSWPATG